MPKKFIFRRNQNIGVAQAELDQHFLEECFINTGDLEILADCQDPRRILAGRTGAGKSALLAQLEEMKEHTIRIRPDELAITYVSNSGVINYFLEAGVKMDMFYILLWRHIFVVEILKHRFHITEESKTSFLTTLFQLIPTNLNRQYARAIDYLKSYSESFWKNTEERVHEIKSTFENQLTGSVNGLIPGAGSLSAAAARKLSEEQRAEIVNRAQEVVNKVQVAELNHVIGLLDTVLLKDHQKKYYVLIDGLDADWVEDQIRFRLIRALIETTLEFTRVHNVKIIVALRNDLLDRVYKYSRVAGFQEEKYRTSTLQISWTRPQLIELLDARIALLVREQYTGNTVSHEDVLVKHIGRRKAVDYMLDRTLMRPRDVIQFFNACIRQADGEPLISKSALLEAEGVYSRERIRALKDEWLELYPNIIHLAELLKRRKQTFFLNEITPQLLEHNYLELLLSGRGLPGLDLEFMNMVFNGNMTIEDYRVNIILILHKVGMVGLKTDIYSKFYWSESGEISVSSAEIHPNSKVMVHPMFWRCLGIDYVEEQDHEEDKTNLPI